MYATGLVCRQCGAESEIAPHYYCDTCFGPLEVRYDYDAIRGHVTSAHVAAGPSTIWRYRRVTAHQSPTGRSRHGLDAAAARRSTGRCPGPEGIVDQERLGQSNLLVQGS